MKSHAFRVVSGSLVMALALSLAGPGSRGMASADEGDPPPDPNAIAEQFATIYGTGEGLPSTGEIDADGNVSIVDSPGQVTISLDPAEGATVVDEAGNEFNVAPVVDGSSDVGLAGDHVVVYDTDPSDDLDVDLAARATGDGGVELAQVLAPGVTESDWTITTDASDARLVELDSGLVAVVEPGGEIDAEMASAVGDLLNAEGVIVDAAVEATTAAIVNEALAEEHVGVTEPGPLSDDLLASSEPVVEVPSDEEVADPDGSVPAYFQAEPDLVELEESVEALERQVDPSDYTPEDIALIESASAQLDAAEAAAEIGEIAALAEEESAVIEENLEVLSEDLDQVLLDSLTEEFTAELDIADSNAEIARSAAALVAAQAEVGGDGRVIGVFGAPMTATSEGDPVPTTVDLVAPDTVRVTVPDIGTPVVVDPFFAPLLFFVARAALQVAVKQIAKAAVKYATREATKRLAAKQAQMRIKQAAMKLAESQRLQRAREAFLKARALAAKQAQRVKAPTAKATAQVKRIKHAAQHAAKQTRAQASKAKAEVKAKLDRIVARSPRVVQKSVKSSLTSQARC